MTGRTTTRTATGGPNVPAMTTNSSPHRPEKRVLQRPGAKRSPNPGAEADTATNAKARTIPAADQIDSRSGTWGMPMAVMPGRPVGDCGSPLRRAQAMNGRAQTAQSTSSRPAASIVPDHGPAVLEKNPPSTSPAMPTWAKRETKTRTVRPQTTLTAAPTPDECGPVASTRRRSPAGTAASSPVKKETIENDSRTIDPETRGNVVRPPM